MSKSAAHLGNLALVLGVAALFWSIIDQWQRTNGTYSLYVWQASAWLHGRLDLSRKLMDVAIWHGRYFVPFPPFPALLVTPIVAIFGVVAANTIPVALALTALNVASLRMIFARVGLESGRSWWLIAAFLFGTGYAQSLHLGSTVWYFAHVVSVTLVLLATREALGKARGGWIGLALGASFLTRQMTVFALVFFAVWLWTKPERVRNLAWLLGVFGACVGVYLAYNALRFGSPLETGYGMLALKGVLRAKAERYGLFHPVYLPYNALYLFVQGPSFLYRPPLFLTPMGVDANGTSLTAASPFVFAAFASAPTNEFSQTVRRAAFCAVLLILVPTLCYYNNGYQQYGCQRFTLDFLPLLVVPIALGVQRLSEVFWRALVLYSVWLNALSLTLFRL